MPIFEYKCKDCGHQFEKIVFRLEEKILCPACGRENNEKQLSAFSLGNSGSASSRSTSASCGSGRFT